MSIGRGHADSERAFRRDFAKLPLKVRAARYNDLEAKSKAELLAGKTESGGEPFSGDASLVENIKAMDVLRDDARAPYEERGKGPYRRK